MALPTLVQMFLNARALIKSGQELEMRSLWRGSLKHYRRIKELVFFLYLVGDVEKED
jgi:hypothetical protein